MKIDEIARLNAERTQGEWNNFNEDYDEHTIEIHLGDRGRLFDEGRHTIHDANFIVVAPKMAEMLIKLRDFKVDADFMMRLQGKIYPCKIYKKLVESRDFHVAKATIELLIEELEKE